MISTGPLLKDPLHGKTLKFILESLVKQLGWKQLGEQIQIKCFTNNPSMSSSLVFLRKTPWARTKVESLYLSTLNQDTENDPDAPIDLGL
jgi:uncharacterized protein (DUF2132 family)